MDQAATLDSLLWDEVFEETYDERSSDRMLVLISAPWIATGRPTRRRGDRTEACYRGEYGVRRRMEWRLTRTRGPPLSDSARACCHAGSA
jgi:hypothetical protein